MSEETQQENLSYYWIDPHKAYEGAVTNYRLQRKGLLVGEQDQLAARELQFLRSRADYLIRNNGYAKTAKRKFVHNLGSVKVKWVVTTGKKAGEIHQEMQDLWDEFAAQASYDSYGSLDNIQTGWYANMWHQGESLSRMIIKKREGVTIPLTVQNIPAEYLDPGYVGTEPFITRNGITFENGEPSIYHFNMSVLNVGFPWLVNMTKTGDYNPDLLPNSWGKVPVPAKEVIHIFQREKEGQWRGIPELAVNLLPLFQLEDLFDGSIQKQVASQVVTWIVENTNPGGALAVGNSINTYDDNATGRHDNKKKVVMEASGGGILYLNRGEVLKAVQNIGLGSEVIDLIKTRLHMIAESSGLKYATLTGDWSGLSFSALQQISIEMKVEAEYIYNFHTIPQGLTKLCWFFKKLAMLYGSKSIAKVEPVYQFPRRYSVNELKDAQADKLEVDAGLAPLTNILAERGFSRDEIENDIAWRKSVGLWIPPNTSISPIDDMKETSSPGTKQMNQANNINPNSNTKG